MAENRRLIEKRLLLAEIDEEAGKEKKGRAATFNLLFWWTRKPLVVSRTAILASLLPAKFDMQVFAQLLGLGKDRRAYNYSPNAEKLVLEYVECLGAETPRVLDPMAGGGSIPFEAIRCGCEAVALEYNPVAYLILKATLEYPYKYGRELADEVKKWAVEVFQRTESDIGHLYPKHGNVYPSAYFWSITVQCPRCGQKNLLIKRGKKGSPTERMWISTGSKVGIKPVLLDNGGLEIEFTRNPPFGTVERGQSTCLRCDSPITNEEIKATVEAENRRLICVIIPSKSGKLYRKPSTQDFEAIEKARELVQTKWKEFAELDLIPTDDIPSYDTRSIWVVLYGLDKWHKLFNPRQLIVLLTFARNILTVAEEIEKTKGVQWAKVISTYLSLMLCKLAARNTVNVLWNRGGEKIEDIFSFRGVPMMWDHAEVNPFSKPGSGTWLNILDQTVAALDFAGEALNTSAMKSESSIEIHYGSALMLPFGDGEFDIVVTDPPYLDDVPYGELSEFYHVWLWRILKGFYRKLPGPKVPVDEELDDNPGRHGSKELSRQFFMNSLTQAFREINRVLKDNGLFTLFFAHSKLEAWKILISSLIQSGFRVTMTWPVRTEATANILQLGKASIQSSILVAARKAPSNGTAFLEDLRPKIAEHIRDGLEEISDLGFTGADLIVAGLGKALEVATRFSELKSYSGNATLESLLEVVSEAVYSYSVERLVNRPLAALDPQTAFYVFVKCGYGGLIPPDDALMICKGAGVELQALQHDKIIDKKKVGSRTVLATLNAHERGLDPNKPHRTPFILDQLHLLELAVNIEGKRGFDRLLSSPTFRAGDVRAVAEGLYNGLLIKKNDPEIELLRPIMDLFRAGAPSPAQDTMDKYFAEGK